MAVQDAETYEPIGVRLARDAETGGHDYFADLAVRTRAAAGDIQHALALAQELGAELPTPGEDAAAPGRAVYAAPDRPW